MLVTVAAVMAVASGCSSGSGAVATSKNGTIDVGNATFDTKTGQKTIQIKVVDNTFEPSYIKVSPGTKLVFTNEGRNQHNITPVTAGSFTAVKTDNFGPGKTASVTVSGAGDYAFYCTIHGTKSLRGQSGVIRVVTG